MSDLLQVPAIITKLITMADSTIRLQVDLQELPQTEEAKVFSYRNKIGVFAFSEVPIEEKHIKVPDYIKIEKEDKSPHILLRNVLFVYWKQNVKSKNNSKSFDDYYREQMEVIRNHFKDKLIKE